MLVVVGDESEELLGIVYYVLAISFLYYIQGGEKVPGQLLTMVFFY